MYIKASVYGYNDDSTIQLFYNVLFSFVKNTQNRKVKQSLLKKLRFSLFGDKAPLLLYNYCNKALLKTSVQCQLLLNLITTIKLPIITTSSGSYELKKYYSLSNTKLFISYHPIYCKCRKYVFLPRKSKKRRVLIWRIDYLVRHHYGFFFLCLQIDATLSQHREILKSIRINYYLCFKDAYNVREFKVLSTKFDPDIKTRVKSMIMKFYDNWRKITLDDYYGSEVYEARQFFLIGLELSKRHSITIPSITIPTDIRKKRGKLTAQIPYYDFKITKK